MHTYWYYGPVLEFDKVTVEKWSAQTVAPSEQKARSNLAYRYKKQYGRVSNVKVTLPGTLKILS